MALRLSRNGLRQALARSEVHINADHHFRPHLPHYGNGNGVDERAVHEVSAVATHGCENTGNRNACANRLDEVAIVYYDLLVAAVVGRNGGEGNVEIADFRNGVKGAQELLNLTPGKEAGAVDADLSENPRHELPIRVFGDLRQLLYTSASVGRADNRPRARPRHKSWLHTDFREVLQHTQVREAAAPAAAKGDSDGIGGLEV